MLVVNCYFYFCKINGDNNNNIVIGALLLGSAVDECYSPSTISTI